MPYDPQAKHRRPRPTDSESAPVEALLHQGPTPTNDDPPPSPSVTPAPADPPPDSLLINTGLVGAVAAVIGLLVLRHLWRRHRSRLAEPDE